GGMGSPSGVVVIRTGPSTAISAWAVVRGSVPAGSKVYSRVNGGTSALSASSTLMAVNAVSSATGSSRLSSSTPTCCSACSMVNLAPGLQDCSPQSYPSGGGGRSGSLRFTSVPTGSWTGLPSSST